MTEHSDETAIDYPALVRQALVHVPRQALRLAAEHGLPGDHHFYLTVRTDHPEVEVPPRVRRQFPEELTIVLQNQFWNLEVEEGRFSVTLRFGGAPERVVIPFDALVSFVDPSVPFGLRLTGVEEATAAPLPEEPSAGDPAAPATVIDMAAFRRARSDEEG